MAGSPPRTTVPYAGARLPRAVTLVALAGLAMRIAVGLLFNVLPHGGLRGYDFYRRTAANLVAGDGLFFRYTALPGESWTNRPPLYPLFLAGLQTVFGDSAVAVVLAQSALGAASVLLVALLALRLAGPRAALIAAVGTAFYPYFVGNDTTLIEQPLLVALTAAFTLVLVAALRRPLRGPGRLAAGACLSGLLAGLCVLTRETALVFAALVALLVLLRRSPAPFRSRLAWSTIFVLSIAAVCSPWLLRNHARFGLPVLSVTAGKALWVGNNAHTFDAYPAGSIDDSETAAWAHLPRATLSALRNASDERERDRLFRRLALEHIAAHPGLCARRGLVKVGQAFTPRLTPPRDGLPALAHAIAAALLLAGGLAGAIAFRRRWSPAVAVFALAFVSVVLVSFVFWGQTRLRATYDPYLIVLASGWLARLTRRRRPVATGRPSTPPSRSPRPTGG
jgi:4-amino-4-deoxy-L-arabinose transferase-like glycosyltransferase